MKLSFNLLMAKMRLGEKLYIADRKAWRSWLAKNHASKKEVWLIYYKKNSGKKRIPYNDAVEEALCYGWIDSILKPIDREKYAQRFSPRKPNANWSATNIERLRRLIRKKKMTRAGLAVAEEALKNLRRHQAAKRFTVPPDILRALKRDPVVWKSFQRFPESYKRIRIGWIDASRNRPDFFRRRLDYFLKMTAKNKRFGMVQ